MYLPYITYVYIYVAVCEFSITIHDFKLIIQNIYVLFTALR